MLKKTLDISIITAGIIFLCWYLPVAYYNVYACDDYWFGRNVADNGFWGNQIFYYCSWEGSYTHTFLASLPHVFHGLHVPFWSNLFSLVFLFMALFFFLRTYTSLTIKRGVLYSFYFLSFMYLCTKGSAEIRFWICANITYVTEMSFLIILLSVYHNLDQVPSYKKWLVVFVCVFFIGGSKLTFILYSISGIIIHDILYERPLNRRSLAVYFFLFVFVMVNVSAPGNYIRLEEETMNENVEGQMNILESVFYRITEMYPFALNTLFLLPISAHWSNRFSFKKNRVLMALTIFVITFVIDSIIMYICFKDSGPLRVYFVAEIFVAILVLFGLNYLYTSVLKRYNFAFLIMVLLASIVSLSNLSMISLVQDSIEFSRKARARDEFVMACKSGETIEILPLPPSYLMLSYFANDEVWLNKIYIPYFRKNSKIVLIDSINR